jgi:hypothetical protein
MSTRVQIGGRTSVPVPFLWRAGRAFPTSGYREVEVLEHDEDPPDVETLVDNPSTGGKRKLMLKDQNRMGRKSYQAILDDGRFAVLQVGEIHASVSSAEVGAARAEVARLSAELMDARTQVAARDAELGRAKEENVALRARIEELEAAATAPAEAPAPKRTKAEKGA